MRRYMETIIEACKALDYSWLPQTVDGFTLVTSTESDYTILANLFSTIKMNWGGVGLPYMIKR